MVDHGDFQEFKNMAYESCFTMVFFLWPWTKVNHGPQGPRLTMVPRVAIYHGMKHGRPWIIHGHFVVNHVLTAFISQGNASTLGARGPRFNPWLRQGFLCLIFLFCCCCVFSFCPKTQYLSQKFAIPFAMLIYLVYFKYCKIVTNCKGMKIQT